MAKQTTEVVLDLNVDQGSMISELEKTKSAIIGLKKEQQDLTKAYKAGEITQEEYAKELVRVEGLLKTSQSTYNNTQKAVTGVKTKMDDLIASNNKLAQSVKASTENIRIGGVTVGDLTTKVTALLNPVTAAAAVVTALGTAYANSAVGANDLARASNNLKALIAELSNQVGNKSGGGIAEAFSLMVSDIAIAFTSNTKEIQKQRKENLENARFQLEQLRALEEQQITVAQIRKETEKAAENARRIRDDQSKSEKDRLEAAKTVTEELNKNEKARVGIIEEQITNLLQYGEAVGTIEKGVVNQFLHEQGINFELIKDRDVRILIRKLVAEAADIQEEINGKLTENIKSQQNITTEINKQNTARIENAKKLNAALKFKPGSDTGDVSFDDDPESIEFDPMKQFEKDKEIIDAELGLVKTVEDEKRAELLRTNAVKQMIADEDRARLEENLQQTRDNFLALADLFSQGSEARKLFALLGIGADTAEAISALTAMSEKNPGNAVTFGAAGIAQYAAGLIRIFSNIAAAKQFLGGSFAGGADFVTTKPTMIMVGDNPGNRERVTVEPLSGRGKSHFNPRAGFASFAGGGSMTFDGQSATALNNVNQYLATSNAIKRMPRPIVGVKQIAEEMNAVQVKQNVSKA